jgi:endonuclease/exonuclease/phosphatase family metal-dependent hydrolase
VYYNSAYRQLVICILGTSSKRIMKTMKTFFWIIFVFIYSFTRGHVPFGNSIIIVSHNVLAFSGHPKDIHEIDTVILQRAIKFYRELNTDILVIQESPSEGYVQILADSLGFNYFFLQEKFLGNKEYPYGFPGCILSKFPFKETFDYNKKKSQIPDSIFQRHWGGVKVETTLGIIQLHSVHLCADWGGQYRESTRMTELAFLLKEVQTCDSCIANIIVGDFNSLPDSNPYNLMIEYGFLDAHVRDPEPTVPVPNPKYKIDYVFYEKGNKVTVTPKSSILPYSEDLNLYLSDHYPCIIMIERNIE